MSAAPGASSSGLRWIRLAAAQGAFAWWVYWMLETSFSVAVPQLRRAISWMAPDRFPPGELAFLGAPLTAVLVLALPTLGAILGATEAGLASVLRQRRLGDEDAGRMLWSGCAALTVIVCFALNALAAREFTVVPVIALPLALSVLRVRASRRAETRARWAWLTHPCVAVAILLGSAFLAQPRPGIPSGLVYALGLACGIGALGSVHIASRTRVFRSTAIHVPHTPAVRFLGAALLSVAAMVAALPQNPGRTLVERPYARPRPGDRRPNVLLITWDTVRADHLSLYGYDRDTTPFLRQFARSNATAFTNAVATSNWTLPTHASIFTGLSPRRHGGHRLPGFPTVRPMSERPETLAGILSREGYRTAGIAANFAAFAPTLGLTRGFAHFDSTPRPWYLAQEARPYLLRGLVSELVVHRLMGADSEARWAGADAINEKARTFLSAAPGVRQPFFLFLNFMDAHGPYVPPPPFSDLFGGRDAGFRWAHAPTPSTRTGLLARPISPREKEHLTSQYDGAIAYLDDRLRRLFGTLRALGVYDDTLIVLMADHGEAFGEGELFGHGVSVYQHQVHVPLVIKFPGSASGAIVDAGVSGVDVLPTILDVVGARQPAGIEGRSLRDLDPRSTRWIFSESDWQPAGADRRADSHPREVAVFFGRLKAISRKEKAPQLYDLTSDPAETRNLYPATEVPAEVQVRLSNYLDSATGEPRDFRTPDPETVERLRSLGYLR